MRCTKCGTDNRERRKFCASCGSPLTIECPKCSAANVAGEQFCGDCGASLTVASNSSLRPPSAAADRAITGERRHLTILFCDLVGSVTLTSLLDPEEWRATVAGYQRGASEAITRFGGEVIRYVGDGIMAFFGYPVAHDNDAERAARAGLAILEAIAKFNQEHATQSKLSVRIGIDSGPVVVGTGAGQAVDAFGDTANIAARVQSAAEPDTVVVSDATHRLISGLFAVEDHGAQRVKGIEQPVQLYRVVHPSGVRSRFEAAAATGGLTPFVGREDELRLLVSRWERAREGEGQVALIIGEAGIGKSRLVQEFRGRIAADRHTWLEGSTATFFQNTPFYATAEMLRQSFHWHSNQNNERRLAALEASLASTDVTVEGAVPLIASLLDLPLDDRYPPLSMPPNEQRKRLLATLVAWAIGTAKTQPLVIVTEDLHWADPSTLEVTQLLVEQGASAPLMLIYTARPEFRPPWSMRAHHTQITLNRLGARDIRAIVAQVTASKALSDQTVAAVVERTGGVPLFVEELTRAVLESGDARLSGRDIPVTLHDSLMARLDRLGPAKEVAQVGAVIGREFSYELLQAIHQVPEAELQAALRELADAELLYVRGIAPEATYQFKHALIRDAAYEALLKSRRKELHRIVARTIDEKFATIKGTHPEILARHWAEAGEAELAIGEWSRAGNAAEARNAFKEALENYQQALALLNLLPESPDRDLRELKLRQSVVVLFYVIRGYSAPETIDATERAAALAEKSGNLKQLVISMLGRGVTASTSGDLPTAAKLLDQALELALREGSPTRLASVYTLQTLTRHSSGDLAGAEKHFTAGLKFFNDPRFRQSPTNGAVAVFGGASWNAWTLGHIDVAREREVQMMTVAKGNNPNHLAYSGYCAAQLRAYMRDYEQAEALAAGALELSEKHQFPRVAGFSRYVLGQARAQLGHPSEGIKLIRHGMAGLFEIGSRVGITNITAYLAEAQERDGSIVEAIETIEQALQVHPDELAYRPEALRLRGELRFKQGQRDLAEAGFSEAIALAQKLCAKSWELRATMSLARLLAEQGNRDEAHTMLAEIYSWFTEGFDTADLKDAKALLDELSS